MKKSKIILIIFLAVSIIITLFMGVNFLMKENTKRIICKKLEEQTGDKFTFIYGLDREWSIATNVRYRGILYSNNLEKIDWPNGLEISLESLNIGNSEIKYIVDSYYFLLKQVEIDGMVEKKSREIFGNKSNLYNDWSMTNEKYQYIKERLGKKGLGWNEKNGAYSTIVNVFVNDLNKLDNEDIKKKTFELAKYIYDDMNYVTALQVYVRDNKYFEDYNLVYYSIYSLFREREDIKAILGKIKNKEKINDEEKEVLVKVFSKGGLDYDVSHLREYWLFFDKKEEIPLKIIKFKYVCEMEKGKYLYFNKEAKD